LHLYNLEIVKLIQDGPAILIASTSPKLHRMHEVGLILENIMIYYP